jgi:hypothetical protein
MHIGNLCGDFFYRLRIFPKHENAILTIFIQFFPLGSKRGKIEFFQFFKKCSKSAYFFCNRVFLDMGNSNLREFFDFEH